MRMLASSWSKMGSILGRVEILSPQHPVSSVVALYDRHTSHGVARGSDRALDLGHFAPAEPSYTCIVELFFSLERTYQHHTSHKYFVGEAC